MLTVLQGSGKTLAYGLPILSKLLEEMQSQPLRKKRHVSALVLTPTRELALQVSSHLNACLTPAPLLDTEATPRGRSAKTLKGKAIGAPMSKVPPLVSVAAIVGGMSPQKQRRILNRGVDVLIATPGRLWDLLEEV
jgi:ATP-dependent RNA helicase DDX24/MAK5